MLEIIEGINTAVNRFIWGVPANYGQAAGAELTISGFTLVYSLVAILGATVELGLLWSIAETFNGLMAIPNLIALLLLSGTVVKLTNEHFAKED